MTASATLPCLRADLVVSRHAAGDGAVFVIKDPVTRQFFRFGEAEHYIAGQLDGSTPLEAVRQRTEQQFGTTLEQGALTAFVSTLGNAGLLESNKPSKSKSGDRRLRGSLLYLRFRLADPD